MMVDPKASQYINYTTNSNGDYIMDVASLDNVPSNIKDPVLTILMSVANSNERIDLEYRDPNEDFNANQTFTFNIIEDTKNKASMGQTLVSGKRVNPEKPDMISSTSRTTIYINRKYGNREAVKSLAHELLHVYRYILGIPWGEDSKGFDAESKTLEKRAGTNFDGSKRASRAFNIN